jgi:DNA-3-methyladenine glycosylase I
MWAEGDPLMQDYHDNEWGIPNYDSRSLWEKLILDGFQAGLSWRTILYRRDGFRQAFEGFDPKVIAAYTADDVDRLMGNPRIIRARAKIEATIGNAKAYLAMAEAGDDFSEFVWSFTDGKPIVRTGGDIPSKTELSERMSKELKTKGFKFVGPVIVYAWMQAVGIVDDHDNDCFCRLRGEGSF